MDNRFYPSFTIDPNLSPEEREKYLKEYEDRLNLMLTSPQKERRRKEKQFYVKPEAPLPALKPAISGLGKGKVPLEEEVTGQWRGVEYTSPQVSSWSPEYRMTRSESFKEMNPEEVKKITPLYLADDPDSPGKYRFANPNVSTSLSGIKYIPEKNAYVQYGSLHPADKYYINFESGRPSLTSFDERMTEKQIEREKRRSKLLARGKPTDRISTQELYEGLPTLTLSDLEEYGAVPTNNPPKTEQEFWERAMAWKKGKQLKEGRK